MNGIPNSPKNKEKIARFDWREDRKDREDAAAEQKLRQSIRLSMKVLRKRKEAKNKVSEKELTKSSLRKKKI